MQCSGVSQREVTKGPTVMRCPGREGQGVPWGGHGAGSALGTWVLLGCFQAPLCPHVPSGPPCCPPLCPRAPCSETPAWPQDIPFPLAHCRYLPLPLDHVKCGRFTRNLYLLSPQLLSSSHQTGRAHAEKRQKKRKLLPLSLPLQDLEAASNGDSCLPGFLLGLVRDRDGEHPVTMTAFPPL